MKVHVYHQDKAAQRNILILTGEATLVERQGAKVTAQLDFSLSSSDRLPVCSGDRILIDSSAAVGESKQTHVLCPDLHSGRVGKIPLLWLWFINLSRIYQSVETTILCNRFRL